MRSYEGIDIVSEDIIVNDVSELGWKA